MEQKVAALEQEVADLRTTVDRVVTLLIGASGATTELLVTPDGDE